MLAWTGIWAATEGGLGLGWHFPGAPVEPDWTKALGVFAAEEPYVFGAILAFICLAEGESVGHSGDNFRGKSTKVPGDLNFDYLGLKKKLSPERLARYKIAELKNGRAAMIATTLNVHHHRKSIFIFNVMVAKETTSESGSSVHQTEKIRGDELVVLNH